MQPIHFATGNSHWKIISALVDQYGVDPDSKSEVRINSCIILMCG